MSLEKLIKSNVLFTGIGMIIVSLIIYPNMLESGVYLNSAHGNTSYGVNRIDTFNLGYSKANCAHCHEQHASINGSEPNPVNGNPSPYLLFANNFTSQSENFCFYCHKGSGSVQRLSHAQTTTIVTGSEGIRSTRLLLIIFMMPLTPYPVLHTTFKIY